MLALPGPASKQLPPAATRVRAPYRQCRMSRLHGLRHRYAQARYEALTGWKALAAGGPKAKELSNAQRAIDRQARLTIS
jgi:hypothetical protein